jgi:phosphate starvation-inducible PhoH-like protein
MRSSAKKVRRNKNNGENPIEFGFKEVKPLNYIQEEYLTAIKSCDVVFGIGSAGTGKTYVAASYAASQLFHREIKKIVITRPSIETGRGLGFLPGELDQKYAPYLQPFETVFVKTLGKGFYEYAIKNRDIDPKPIGFMRGSNFEDCVVLVDEAQNLTKTELKMLLTRIGRNCKIILSGDPKQTDIANSGLLDAVARLENSPGIEVVRFLDDDIVRSKMCKQIILAYNN